MLNKELIIDKFIKKCKEINPEISSKGFRRISEVVISNAGGDKSLIVRNLSYELVKIKRQQHILIKFTKVKPMAIN